jgi:predicted signal transduction protein with EAL and GGDEF domain
MIGERKWRLFRDEGGAEAGPLPFVYVLLFIVCIALGQWSVVQYQSVLVWPANGVLLAAALQLHRRKAIAVLATCFVINVAGNVLRGDAVSMNVMFVSLNFAEVLLAALLARRFCGATLDLRRPTRLARFVFIAVAPPVLLAALIGVAARQDPPEIFLLNVSYWFMIETMGFLVTTPALLLLAKRHEPHARQASMLEKAGLFGLLIAVTLVVFSQSAAPVLFLVFVPLLIIAFRLPPRSSAFAVMIVALMAGGFSLNGYGPMTFSTLAPADWPQDNVLPVLSVLPVYHLFISAALAVSFGASTILSERRRLEARLRTQTITARGAQEKAEAAERRVTHLALHDADTALPNRLGLEREVAAMLPRQAPVFVAAIGIDRFTSIRAAIGVALAEQLMSDTARRLSAALPEARVARIATNSLGVAFEAQHAEEAMARLQAARSAFAEPVAVGASRVDVRLTAGLAGAPEHAATTHALVQRAQIALDQAYAGQTEIAVFDAAAEHSAASSLTLMSELREGLASGAVWLAHQPKLDLRKGEITSVESLVRWRHPARGAIAPDAFIGLAEETGLIGTLTDWVLTRALVEQAALARDGRALKFAVNVSARNLCEPGFAARLAAIASARGADTQQITLEITETAVMVRPDIALANLEALKQAGFAIAVDDYGAGMSSLSYLKRIPADELKIDASFIRNLAGNANDAVLVRSTIDLGHSLGLKVVAEGVETQAALELLALFGCDMAQGYLIGRPVQLSELTLDTKFAFARPPAPIAAAN